MGVGGVWGVPQFYIQNMPYRLDKLRSALAEVSTKKHSKYGIQAYELTEAELAEAETEKTPFASHMISMWRLINDIFISQISFIFYGRFDD